MSKLAKALTAAAGNAAGESLYVEDVFSTYLYEGSDDTGQNIVNGINLSEEGGLVWMKTRNTNNSHSLYDTERGSGKGIATNLTNGEFTNTNVPFDFNSNGFFTGRSYVGSENGVGKTIASWTFRKAEKFFDVVTWTGNGTSQVIAHALNSTIGSVFIKRIDSSFDWKVYHISLGTSQELELNQTGAAASTGGTVTAVSDSSFTVGGGNGVNASGGTYVAYLFASDAGGFGDDGSESIIKCGSYTGTGSALDVSLGFEPQWIMFKRSDSIGDWLIYDVMRGIVTGGSDERLEPNTSDAAASSVACEVTATGFTVTSTGTYMNASGGNYIYIAIRRPMKTPESGTEVFAPVLYTGDGSSPKTVSGAGFAPDALWQLVRTGSAYSPRPHDKLRGTKQIMSFNSQSAEYTDNNVYSLTNDGAEFGSQNNNSGVDYASYFFKRAYSFFDVVCYTGDGASTKTITHGLGVTPELAIVKRRNVQDFWAVAHKDYLPSYNSVINSTNGFIYDASRYIQNLSSSTFRVGTYDEVNASGSTYVAYLYATLAGVSKVGSYTGTGSNIDIDCGFSAGARFVLIKGGSGGNWYVWDSARGIIAGNDPYQVLNSSANDVTSTDYIDPLSSGFTVTSSAPADMNTNGQTYIFLAIA